MNRRDRAVLWVPAALAMLTACSAVATGSGTSTVASPAVEVDQEPMADGTWLRAVQVWPQVPVLVVDSAASWTAGVEGGVGSAGASSRTSSPEPTGSISVVSAAGVDGLIERVGMTERLFDAAVRDPEDRTLLVEFEATTVAESPARSEFVDAYWALVEAGRWAVPDPVVANSVTVLPDGPPILADDGLAAWVLVCAVSGDSLMGVDELGEPVVLADVRNAREVWQEFRLVDGEWLLYERWQVAIYPEATSCNDVSVSSSVPS